MLRSTARTLRTTAPRRFYATPGPQPTMTKPASNPPKTGNSTVPLVVAAIAVAGGGWYYLSSTGKDDELKAKAKELQHSAEAKGEKWKKECEASSRAQRYKEGEAKLDKAKYEAEKHGHDAQNALQRGYEQARNKAEEAVDKTKAATEQTVESAKATGSSWWSWGSGKAEDAKEKSAAGVRDTASKVEKEANKRT
ncbi:SubName: Full=Uncharacterized protein {ECO:0000313/EMBL:CCA75889.1} [Serendipita indica DSM 11827]|nr:SubName: Full=Uncharacterized protein {ECO:0000313/EMBL:CCA75889.1} [Serendipita indica DSM 11827]